MKSIALIIFVFSCATCISGLDQKEEFEQLCQRESKLKNEFDELNLDEYKKRVTWERFLDTRQRRLDLGDKLGVGDCPEGYQMIADKQLFHLLCADEQLLSEELSSCQNEKLKKELKRLHKEAASRLVSTRFEGMECPKEEINADKRGKISTALEEYLEKNCKNEVLYEYVVKKVEQLKHKVPYSGFYPLEVVAGSKWGHARGERRRFCDGLSIGACCGEQLVEEAQAMAISKGASMVLRSVDDLTLRHEANYEAELSHENWSEKFEVICELEKKTAAGSGHYVARSRTLTRLNRVATRERILLGMVLGEPECRVELDPPEAEVAAKSAKVQAMTIESRCEEESKAHLMCERLNEEAGQDDWTRKYHQNFAELLDTWCARSKQIQEAKISPLVAYKPPECTDEMRDAMAEDAQVELEVRLELLQLSRMIERAIQLKELWMAGKREASEVISQLKEVFKKDASDQASGLRKEQARLAYELLKSKREELEAAIKEDVKKHKPFKKLLKPTKRPKAPKAPKPSKSSKS